MKTLEKTFGACLSLCLKRLPRFSSFRWKYLDFGFLFLVFKKRSNGFSFVSFSCLLHNHTAYVVALFSACPLWMKLVGNFVLKVPSMLPPEAFRVVRKSFDARKVCKTWKCYLLFCIGYWHASWLFFAFVYFFLFPPLTRWIIYCNLSYIKLRFWCAYVPYQWVVILFEAFLYLCLNFLVRNVSLVRDLHLPTLSCRLFSRYA